jgi:uncharacterized phage protein (TIGR01671 family)
MSRLRFRAWDLEYKEMTYFNLQSTYFLDEVDTNLIITQWTGLKDKDGVEIFEGDIVIVPAGFAGDNYYVECFAFVKYNAPEFVLIWDNKNGNETVPQEFSWDRLEVIGNIFESKELIE